MKSIKTVTLLAVMLAMPFVVISTAANATAQQNREQEAYDTAVDAYIYLYSLVTMDITRPADDQRST